MSDSYLLVFTTLDRIYFYYAFNYIFAVAASNSTSIAKTLHHPIDFDRPGDRWSPAACLLWPLLCLLCPVFSELKNVTAGLGDLHSHGFSHSSYIWSCLWCDLWHKSRSKPWFITWWLHWPIQFQGFHSTSESFRGILTMLDCTERHILGDFE